MTAQNKPLKHTPGLWKSFDRAGNNMQSYSQSSGVITADGKKIVCGCFKDIGGDDVASANAHLIAAAPELLEACKKALTCGLDSSVREIVMAAIAKARGAA